MSKIVQEVRNELENYRYVNYISVFEAFSRDGWVRNHDFQAGNNWKKGEDEVTCLLGKYRLNGKEVDEEFIHQMLHIDNRYIQMCEFIGPDHLPKNKYHETFLEGVK